MSLTSACTTDLAWCPVSECGGSLVYDSTASSGGNPLTGLETLVCKSCGHAALRATEALQLVHHSGPLYVFRYGPSVNTITIVLSRAAEHLFELEHVTPLQLAFYGAHWTLLTGRTMGAVELSVESLALVDCYEYFLWHVKPHLSGGVRAA
jgi:hypothetical protein